MIAQCVDESDVVRSLRFARDLDLPVAVRGGGHSVAGMALATAALVVDLRHMRGVTVDPGAGTARIAGGATMSDAGPRLPAPTGWPRPAAGPPPPASAASSSAAAPAGWTAGSAWPWTTCSASSWSPRRAGRSRATADEHPDLFWALHGGGGNFGVATALTLELHEMPEFSIALLLHLPEFGPEVTRTYRDVITAGPDEAGGAVIYFTGPPAEFVPPHLVGSLLCGVLLTYAGPEEDLRKLAQPLLALPHEAEVVGAMPYADVQCMLDDPPGMRNYWSAEYLTGAPDDFVDVYCARGRAMPVPTGTMHTLFPQGGAVAAGPHEYPVPYRDAPWAVHPFGLWADPADDERCVQWVRDVRADAQPWSTGAVYLNFIGDEGADRVVAGVGEANARRLADVKRGYDPENVFRFNHNIRPA